MSTKLLISIAMRIIDFIGLPRLILSLKKPQAIILLYHGVSSQKGSGIFNYRKKFISPSAFEQHLIYLKKNFDVVSLTELVETVATKKPFSRSLVAITFDDGYKNNFTEAYPILKKENVPATFFITTNFIEKNIPLPVDQIEYAINTTEQKNITLEQKGGKEHFTLDTIKNRLEADKTIRSKIKRLPPQQVDMIIDELIRKTGKNLADNLIGSGYEPMSWPDIQEMETNGMTFAAHTVSHPVLSNLSEEEARKEIQNSTATVKRNTKNPLRIFAYPNGGSNDFTPTTYRILKENTYEAALTTIPGTAEHTKNLFCLPRYTIDGANELYRFKIIVSGIRDTIARTLRYLKK